MKILLTFLASVLLVSTTFAESKCDLDGGGQLNLTCENKALDIKVELSGDGDGSLQATRVDSAKVHFAPDLEKELPLLSFERLEEGVFVSRIAASSPERNNVSPILNLMAIPASVRMGDIHKLTQPRGALEGSGTFTGRLIGLFNANSKDYEQTRVDTKVSCSFNFVRCPR